MNPVNKSTHMVGGGFVSVDIYRSVHIALIKYVGMINMMFYMQCVWELIYTYIVRGCTLCRALLEIKKLQCHVKPIIVHRFT